MSDQINQNEPASTGGNIAIEPAIQLSSGENQNDPALITPILVPGVDDFQYVFPNLLKLALRITLGLAAFFFVLYLFAISLGAKQRFDKSRAIDFVQRTALVLSKYQAAAIPVEKLDSVLGAVRLDMTHHLADSSYYAVNLSGFYQGADQQYVTIKIDADTADVHQLLRNIHSLPDTAIRGYHNMVNFDLRYIGNVPFERYDFYQFVTPADNIFNKLESPAYYILMICIASLFICVVLITYDFLQKKLQYEHQRKILLAQANAGKPNLSWIDAQVMLQTYYRRNLQQNTWTFFLSVIVMALGFGLIFFGINTAIQMNKAYAAKNQVNTAAAAPENKTDIQQANKVVTTPAAPVALPVKSGVIPIVAAPANDGTSLITIVSTASGVIVNLIAGGFLALYNSTLKQGMDYTSSLQKTSTVGTSLAILETIDKVQGGGTLDAETTAKIIDAKIAIAKQLIGTPNLPA